MNLTPAQQTTMEVLNTLPGKSVRITYVWVRDQKDYSYWRTDKNSMDLPEPRDGRYMLKDFLQVKTLQALAKAGAVKSNRVLGDGTYYTVA